MLRPQEGLGMPGPLSDEIVLEEADKLGRGKGVSESKGACARMCVFMGTYVCLCVCKCEYFCVCVFTHMHAEFGAKARGAMLGQ